MWLAIVEHTTSNQNERKIKNKNVQSTFDDGAAFRHLWVKPF